MAACVQRNPEVILEFGHFEHAVDHIQCYCKSKSWASEILVNVKV